MSTIASASASKKTRLRHVKALFEPRSIAVVGASRRPETVGGALIENLLSGGYTGRIYPVNPSADEIRGIHCHASVTAIPENFDLAVIVVPSHAVAATLAECGKKNCPAAIVITAGFKEIGDAGRTLEAEVIETAERYGITLLGPNCLGLINTDPGFLLNASFARSMPKAGNIAFVSQSGALCTAVLDYAKGGNIGFSKFVSLGNKASVNENDLLEYLKDDDGTSVILMYLEDLVDGKNFIRIAREITGELKKPKPILVIKSGRTAQGAKAAQSHTGSLMGSDEVYDAIFAQAGILRMDSIEEMFSLAEAFSKQPIPQGGRVAIVTNAGGPGIMATDACIRAGLSLAHLDDATVEALKKVLPHTANFHNPVDVIGDARHDRYEEAIKITAVDPNVDSLLVILTPQAMTEIEETARVIVRAAATSPVPILACFMGIADISAGERILDQSSVPYYRFPEGAARALGAMFRYRKWTTRLRTSVRSFPMDKEAISKILTDAAARGRTVLPAHESMRVLEAAGFPVLPYAFVRTAAEAAETAGKLGFPVAVKLVAEKIVHKFDWGAVALGLADAASVKTACQKMLDKVRVSLSEDAVDGFFIQKMAAPGGVEVIAGMNRDPQLGPAVMFGLGGVYVEVLKDVTFRLAPLRQRSAKLMIESIRAYPILQGVRGQKPRDTAKLAECLERLSQLACEFETIREIDINPLSSYEEGKGASVLDARVILAGG